MLHIYRYFFPVRPKFLQSRYSLVTPYGNIPADLNQHWFKWWLVAWWHQAITWSNVDLSSMGPSGILTEGIYRLTTKCLKIIYLKILPHLQKRFMGQQNSKKARFMGPTWGPSGADRTQVGPMLAPWTLLSGCLPAHDPPTSNASSGLGAHLVHRDIIPTKIGPCRTPKPNQNEGPVNSQNEYYADTDKYFNICVHILVHYVFNCGQNYQMVKKNCHLKCWWRNPNLTFRISCQIYCRGLVCQTQPVYAVN